MDKEGVKVLLCPHCLLSDEEKCEACGKNAGAALHTCPFLVEIKGDSSLCNCCADCKSEC